MDKCEEHISYESLCDEILINEVNNVDVKITEKLDDLFTRIGPRDDFLPRPVIEKEVPFDMGYDGILINEVNNVDVRMEEDLDDLFTEIGPRDDFLLSKVLQPKSKYPPGYAMSPNKPKPFNMGYDDFLFNEVNNVDVKMEENLDDLFIEIGPRDGFQLPKAETLTIEYPPGYAMSPDDPPPFDMGYDDILINKVNNVDVRKKENLNVLFTKIGPRYDFIPPPKIIKEKPFDMGYKDFLINEVNNRDIKLEENLNDLFTKIGPRVDFLLSNAVKPKRKYPPGYAMSPVKPPPFDMGYDDILINEANNEDVKMNESLYDLLKKIGPRVDFIKEKLGKARNRKTPPPFDIGYDVVLINKINNKDDLLSVSSDEVF